MENHKTAIEGEAKKLGFDLISFSDTNLPQNVESTFASWIGENKHGDMEYLANRIKNQVDLNALLPGVKSVISLGMNYFQGTLTDCNPNPLMPNKSQESKTTGRVARYAITRDYHKIIKAKLKKLQTFLEKNLDCKVRVFVDTGPILERAYASKSGLGYIGNNSCLITEKFGSWVFIAEILTDFSFEPDKKGVKISCGSCRRCIDLCPTQAINEDKTINATKCISYLTIENKGEIPVDLREKVGNWLYGCDICQDVCPHNAKAKPTKVEDFKEIRVENRRINLKKILSIKDDEEFLKLFAGSPIMRAKRRGLLRNACVVAGNSGNAKLVPALKNILENEEDSMLQEHANWAIEKIISANKR